MVSPCSAHAWAADPITEVAAAGNSHELLPSFIGGACEDEAWLVTTRLIAGDWSKAEKTR